MHKSENQQIPCSDKRTLIDMELQRNHYSISIRSLNKNSISFSYPIPYIA